MSDQKQNEQKAGADCAQRLVRPALLDGSEFVLFHCWTDQPRCAVGDGSAIYIDKTAVIEMPDGKVTTCSPPQLRFTDRTEPGWWCKCEESVDPEAVTHDERCDGCGTGVYWTNAELSRAPETVEKS